MSIVDDLRAAGAVWPGAGEQRRDWYPFPLDPQLERRLLDARSSYAAELRDLDERLREVLPVIGSAGGVTQLADVEGDLLYCLLRETRPATVFEISPADGWSTNHILAALTANGAGTVHSFELRSVAPDGTPTEQAIRANLHPDLDSSRLEVHVGDAREKVTLVNGPIDFLFLDSAHEAWFAEWYAHDLFPRTRGLCFIHDIVGPSGMVKNQPYSDGEAYALLEWFQQDGIRAASAAALEETLDLPSSRRRLDLVSFGVVVLSDPTEAAAPAGRPRALIQGADLALAHGDAAETRFLLDQAMTEAGPATPHLKLQIAERFRRLGLVDDARAVVREVAREHDVDPVWLFEAGRALVLLGRPLEGKRLVWRAQRIEPAPPWLRETRQSIGRRSWSALKSIGSVTP